MEAGGQAAELHLGGVAGERFDQDPSAPRVHRPHTTKVLVEAARLDQAGEGELLEHRRAAVVAFLLGGDPVGQDGWADDPAEAEAGSERLADRPERSDPVRRQSLKRAYGLTVVAELGVVVVLEDRSVAVDGPLDQRLPAIGGED